jgi:hypothetical protein
VSLALDNTNQSHVLEFALEDQLYLEIPVNQFPNGRKHLIRGGITGMVLSFRSVESSADYGLDWSLKAEEEDDGTSTYWNDTSNAWAAAQTWNAIADEVTVHTSTVAFNTTTNDAAYTLFLRATDGATATGNTSQLYEISMHPPIVATQGFRLGPVDGAPFIFRMPYRGRLAFWADGASTAYIHSLGPDGDRW